MSVDLEWPIAQVSPMELAFVIRTEPESGSRTNSSVYASGFEGDILWRVGGRKHVYDDSPYTNIELKDGELL